MLHAFHQKDSAKFDHMFGEYSSMLMNAQTVKHANFAGFPPLRDGLKAALADKEFQHVQFRLRREDMTHKCEIANKNGFASVTGQAEVADTANQLGNGAVKRILHHIAKDKPEHQRIIKLTELTNFRDGGEHRDEKIQKWAAAFWHKHTDLDYVVKLGL